MPHVITPLYILINQKQWLYKKSEDQHLHATFETEEKSKMSM